MHILTVVGARPQFVKAAVVSQALKATGQIVETLIHTGQHYDVTMSDIFFSELGIPSPSVSLGVGSASHGAQTGRMIEKLEEVMIECKPEMLLVYGDTNSTLAGAIAASKLHIPIAHVEAGLRSHNRSMPEEVNRILTDHVSTKLFAPSSGAVENLRLEGIRVGVTNVGDVMYDAALQFKEISLRRTEPSEASGIVQRFEKYVLATIHRADTTDSPEIFGRVLEGLNELSRSMPVVMPAHPRLRSLLSDSRLKLHSDFLVIAPVGYLDMLLLESNATVIVTDSGGVQKEAFFHQIPCVTVRTETEWTELVESGWNTLVNPAEAGQFLAQKTLEAVGRKGNDAKPYGDGDAAARIADQLLI